MNLFRPKDLPKSYIFKQRMAYGRNENYNWQSRVKWYPAGWKYNQKVIGDQFARLHYLAVHAPEPINKQYRKAYNNLHNKLFPKYASIRYSNTWSCDRWL